MGWSQRLFGVIRRALSKEVKEQVGTDRFGNKYYYIPEYKNWRGQTIREKRIVEAANKSEIDYEVGDIPTEWEAWIRKTRQTPPTMEASSSWILVCQPLLSIGGFEIGIPVPWVHRDFLWDIQVWIALKQLISMFSLSICSPS
ncbi:NADH dehydrogenase [ubiquinone] 1 alpha subcomplex assembly factor 2 isoform X2 [Bos indicus]|uniref:NADH dehydrogenase [ubiquinone] 1 alpha subcomplex assembly factor 2 isoform X2 n=1 Tax=Bos indicus TaxID=9915 RepID=A0ABM4R5C6_BOSIN|nr:NADH dehydrogenase [ubiquinone] 1 alpha subcomplex assembly factor 2 isoform X1 [Bos indicus x Bos taurus]